MAWPRVWAALSLVAALAVGAGPSTEAKRQDARRPRAARADSSLASLARVSADSARAIARKRVPGGTLKSEELERERGRVIYSFEFRVRGKRGITEVNVDARSGRIVSVEHESPPAGGDGPRPVKRSSIRRSVSP